MPLYKVVPTRCVSQVNVYYSSSLVTSCKHTHPITSYSILRVSQGLTSSDSLCPGPSAPRLLVITVEAGLLHPQEWYYHHSMVHVHDELRPGHMPKQ